AKGAVEALRREGGKVGLFRPITLWPFPIDLLKPYLGHIDRFVVVEASQG
ncbi:MAG TPA: pyruvate ferredoxin oxidoreductase, partial [Acidobacteria bacterium]|nr:pyruvate ferredoxin oxidoreductase [Acidobacteriota bacterium]